MALLVGYAWDQNHEKQVCWVTPNGEIGELSIQSTAPSWQGTQLGSPVVGGDPVPFAVGPITAYSWPSGNSKDVCFLTDDTYGTGRHIHAINFTLGGGWWHTDLTTYVAGALQYPCVGNLSGYAWAAQGTKQVAYRATDGDMHELYVGVGGTWQHANLTQLAGAGTPMLAMAPDSPISGYAWGSGGTKQVVYKTSAQHIIELWTGVTGQWQHADLTQRAQPTPPLANGSFLAGYAWESGGTKQVVFTTADGDIHELWTDATGQWRYANLTQSAKPEDEQSVPPGFGPSVQYAAYAWEAGKAKQVAYVASDGDIHELYIRVGETQWTDVNLTQRAGAPPPDLNDYFSAYAWESYGTKQVVYTHATPTPPPTPTSTLLGEIHELYAGYIGGVPHDWRDAVLPSQAY